ncbi:MAG: hypothetical protein GYA02_15355, partial [Clostridiaceae bacterium]|nr:hypothetical protein [Clostridiaceae bacterium]
LAAAQAFYIYDAGNTYIKWFVDLAETQIESGRIASIAPTAGWGYQERVTKIRMFMQFFFWNYKNKFGKRK